MSTLLIVDVQNDFCPGGALAVSGGDRIIPIINRLIPLFDVVVASRDWHPEVTAHFEKWPVHCVAGTPGAEYHPELDKSRIEKEFLKGTSREDDGYSAFEATNADLAAWLREHADEEIHVCGLATDYCVRATVLDALSEGFRVNLIMDAIAAVDPETRGAAAIEEMLAAGANALDSSSVGE